MAAKAGLIEDNRPPTPFTMSSESDRSPQLAENTGFKSISSLRFECAKLFVDLLSRHAYSSSRVPVQRTAEAIPPSWNASGENPDEATMARSGPRSGTSRGSHDSSGKHRSPGLTHHFFLCF